MSHNDGIRRPMGLRNDPLIKRICSWLAQSGVKPNHVSVFIFVFSLLSSMCLILSCYFVDAAILLYLLSMTGIGLRLVCSLLDGMLAIEMGKKVFDGDIYNELPEIASDLVLFCSVGWVLQTEWPWGLALGVFVSWLSLATSFIRRLGASLVGKPYFFGLMGKLNRMIVLLIGLSLQSTLHFFNSGSYLVLLITLSLISVGCIQTVAKRVRCLRADLKLGQTT